MSTMLEQAIIDADALREVAVKNAESLVIEKYADQIKEAVETLLEQPEDELAMGLGPEIEEPMDSGLVDDMTLAATDGEPACPCPDDQEEVEIDFAELQKQVADAEAEMGGEEPPELAAIDMLGDEEEPLMEEIELSKEELEDILEELTVDISPQKSGWSFRPQSELDLAEEQMLANAQDSEVKEEKEAIRKAVKELEEVSENTSKELQKTQNLLSESQKSLAESDSVVEKLQKTVNLLRDKLNESNISNAKLLYTNKVLLSDSMNERQKNQVAEAITKAESVEEAKVIFETLQNTVGSTSKKQPKSLSEAVQRTSSIMMPRNRGEKKQKLDPTVNRWQALACINNKQQEVL